MKYKKQILQTRDPHIIIAIITIIAISVDDSLCVLYALQCVDSSSALKRPFVTFTSFLQNIRKHLLHSEGRHQTNIERAV